MNIYYLISSLGIEYLIKPFAKEHFLIRPHNTLLSQFNLPLQFSHKKAILERTTLYNFTTARSTQKRHNINPHNLKSLKIGSFKNVLYTLYFTSIPSTILMHNLTFISSWLLNPFSLHCFSSFLFYWAI